MLITCQQSLLCVLLPLLITAPDGVDPADGSGPGAVFTLSKETTRITEPLRDDGYPDYLAALNQRSSEGVTPANNAAVLLAKAMGPAVIGEFMREKYYEMLGIPPLPEEGEYFVSLAHHEATSKTPWTAEEFPAMAGWLEVNREPLELVIEASKLPRRYDPLVCAEGEEESMQLIL